MKINDPRTLAVVMSCAWTGSQTETPNLAESTSRVFRKNVKG